MPATRRTPPRGSGPRGPSRLRGGRGGGRGDAVRDDGADGGHRFTSRAFVLVVVVVVLMVSYASSLRAYVEQREHISRLEAQIAASEQNISELRREQRRWRDPAFVEAQARQRFGWVMPGEIGYQVIGADGEPLGVTDELTDPDRVAPASGDAWWDVAWGSVVAAGEAVEESAPAEQIGRLRGGQGRQEDR